MSGPRPSIECPCAGAHAVPAFSYEERPAGETAFDFAGAYRRAYLHCELCDHWFSRHDIDMSGLYAGTYMGATYGESMRANFDRIMRLAPECSDNAGRVARVLAFARAHLSPLDRTPRLLDIGSGLAVFPARMREAGWACTALDPDSSAADHARRVAAVEAVTGDFLALDLGALGRFDAVTFNKVLEHVEAPVAMLRRAATLLGPHGFAYVEVPDGAAAAEGPGREEFFIEHHHVFSPASLALTAARAGFSALAIERLREPSGKFTLRGFLVIEQRRMGITA
jgi:SAM-dependent methyltransferase